ncbi:hypothetical protein [Methylobacterium trifolii]|uniref:Uncharacterized protein n=1 Tax=Methylobacterium trifolii TaxID=1003092 RepID=A0ABQ4U182_9HYPH|nr:hypothetical protein [Methylobacterium trifolii]GJE60902.1 hypothetical protein MPOCJGCO_3021 [Methylobacterium trifolii]
MIDIVKAVQAQDPSLGTCVVVLRPDSRALSGPEQLSEGALAWIAERAPGARLVRATILLAPYPGGLPAERTVSVMAFADARQLAAFATAWTVDPEPDEAEAETA